MVAVMSCRACARTFPTHPDEPRDARCESASTASHFSSLLIFLRDHVMFLMLSYVVESIHFIIKSASDSGFDGRCCWPESRACSPALRFLARFLLLALAVAGFGASTLSAAFCILAFALAAFWREIGAGAGSGILVTRAQRPQVKSLDRCGGFAGGCVFLVNVGLFDAFVRAAFFLDALSVSSFSCVPCPGIIMCPQAAQTCCRSRSEGVKSLE